MKYANWGAQLESGCLRRPWLIREGGELRRLAGNTHQGKQTVQTSSGNKFKAGEAHEAVVLGWRGCGVPGRDGLRRLRGQRTAPVESPAGLRAEPRGTAAPAAVAYSARPADQTTIHPLVHFWSTPCRSPCDSSGGSVLFNYGLIQTDVGARFRQDSLSSRRVWPDQIAQRDA